VKLSEAVAEEDADGTGNDRTTSGLTKRRHRAYFAYNKFKGESNEK